MFYPVDDDRIKAAEEKLGFSLPEEFIEFYNKIGYGFFWRKNRVVLTDSYHHYKLLKLL
ncbi:SMI1/KNR4 family protein [Pedobacter sp. UYP1]|uniref:SMI1/KNR4 family protein n=1 Tax=Pedobacter sp. UYP1 TaxID=1756396 RepID=UPI003396090B